MFADYPKEKRMTYVKKYYDAFHNLKLIFQRQLWQVLEHLFKQYASCVLVDTDDTLPSIFSSDMAIGTVMLRSVLGLVLTLVEYEASMRGYEGVKYSTQALFPSLKNLRQQLSAALKTELGAVRLLFTSLFGTKR